MKKLLLTWIFSGSLDGFSQDTTAKLNTWCIKHNVVSVNCAYCAANKPDTIRATLIVFYDRGPAIVHTKPGYVVYGSKTVYLDDKKVIIKRPLRVLMAVKEGE